MRGSERGQEVALSRGRTADPSALLVGAAVMVVVVVVGKLLLLQLLLPLFRLGPEGSGRSDAGQI